MVKMCSSETVPKAKQYQAVSSEIVPKAKQSMGYKSETVHGLYGFAI